jgi:hypothetical protein
MHIDMLQVVYMLNSNMFQPVAETIYNLYMWKCWYSMFYKENDTCRTMNRGFIAFLLFVTEVSNSFVSHCSDYQWCFHPYSPRLPSAEILIFSTIFSQALFMSLLNSKFSYAANPFEILNWYSNLTSTFFSSLRLNLSTSNFGAAHLLPNSLSPISATI